MEAKHNSLSSTYSCDSESSCRRGYLLFSWSAVLHTVEFHFLLCVCVCVLHDYLVASIHPNSCFFSWFSGRGFLLHKIIPLPAFNINTHVGVVSFQHITSDLTAQISIFPKKNPWRSSGQDVTTRCRGCGFDPRSGSQDPAALRPKNPKEKTEAKL